MLIPATAIVSISPNTKNTDSATTAPKLVSNPWGTNV
jgi:hypothetical protein